MGPKRFLLEVARLSYASERLFLLVGMMQVLAFASSGTPKPPVLKKPSDMLEYSLHLGLPSFDEWQKSMTDLAAALLSQVAVWVLAVAFFFRGRVAQWHFFEPDRAIFGYICDGLDVIIKVLTKPLLVPIVKMALLPIQ